MAWTLSEIAVASIAFALVLMLVSELALSVFAATCDFFLGRPGIKPEPEYEEEDWFYEEGDYF